MGTIDHNTHLDAPQHAAVERLCQRLSELWALADGWTAHVYMGNWPYVVEIASANDSAGFFHMRCDPDVHNQAMFAACEQALLAYEEGDSEWIEEAECLLEDVYRAADSEAVK